MSAPGVLSDTRMLNATEQQVHQAQRLTEELTDAELRSTEVKVEVAGHETLTVPPQLAHLLREMIEVVAQGGSVSVTTLPEDVTTTVAARMLDMSRPTLMKLVRSGEIPSHKVGSHTRLRSADVMDHKKRRLTERKAVFRELLDMEAEFGVED